MQFTLDKSSKFSYFDQVKHQLTAALHMGGLKHHQRLPTVREMARVLGVNPKTVLKIYHRLQSEGFIEVRVGSGARVGAVERKDFEQNYVASLVTMMERHLEEAQRLQFSSDRYLALLHEFIDQEKRRDIFCLVVECNTEQIRLFADEISSRTGVTTHPVMIDDLLSPGRSLLSLLHRASFLITTDFHWADVKRVAHEHKKIPLKVRLKPEFLPALIQGARKGGVLMVVSNMDYFSNFRNALRDLGYKSILPRIHAVLASDERCLQAFLKQVKNVYVSPLCGPTFKKRLPPDIHIIEFPEHLSADSLHALRTAMQMHHMNQVLTSLPVPLSVRNRHRL